MRVYTIAELLADPNLNPAVRAELLKPPICPLSERQQKNTLSTRDERGCKRSGTCPVCGKKYSGYVVVGTAGPNGTCSQTCYRKREREEKKRKRGEKEKERRKK